LPYNEILSPDEEEVSWLRKIITASASPRTHEWPRAMLERLRLGAESTVQIAEERRRRCLRLRDLRPPW
jgi:hypothetical protein